MPLLDRGLIEMNGEGATDGWRESSREELMRGGGVGTEVERLEKRELLCN